MSTEVPFRSTASRSTAYQSTANRSTLVAAVAVFAAALCVAVTIIHVQDQGGVTAFNGPPSWMGWGYRALEVGALAVALALLVAPRHRLVWCAALAVGVGPFVGFLLSRTTGLPSAHDDVGDWSQLGIVSLFVEGALILTAFGALAGLGRLAAGVNHSRRESVISA